MAECSAAVDAACDVLELISASVGGAEGGGLTSPVTAGDWSAVAGCACSPEAATSAAMWAALGVRGVTPSALGAGLCALVCGASKGEALCAAAAYAALLGSPGCPVFSVFNAVAFEGTLKALRDAAAVAAAAAVADKAGGRKGKAQRAKAAAQAAARMELDGEEEELDEEAFGEEGPAETELTAASATAGCVAILSGLRRALALFPLRDAGEAHKQAVEALAAVAAAPPICGLTEEALAALRDLLRPHHGDLLPSAAAQMQRLSATLLASGGRGSAGAAALEYVRSVAAEVPQARQAAAALVRHLCLRCGERAETRNRVRGPARARERPQRGLSPDGPAHSNAAHPPERIRAPSAPPARSRPLTPAPAASQAAEAAAVVLGALPACETESFVSFLGRLSRSPTAAHRGFAAELAPVLLGRLAEPFAAPEPWAGEAAAGGAARTGEHAAVTPGGARTPSAARTPGAAAAECMWSPALAAGATPGTPSAGPRQPWGVVCMQLLVQRASDKVPAVRARALQALAEAAGRAPDAAEDAAALHRLLGGQLPSQAQRATHMQVDGDGHDDARAGAVTPGSGLRAAAGGAAFAQPGLTPGTVLFLRRCGGRTPGVESAPGSAGGGSAGGGSSGGGCSAGVPPEPASPDLGDLLRTRTRDEKGGVRRAALLALEAVALATGGASAADVAAVGCCCEDALLSVRKQALACLCRLLAAQPDAPGLAAAFLSHALPLCCDCEPAVQDKALEAAETLLLGGIAAWGKRGAAAAGQQAVADALLRCLGCGGASACAGAAAAVAALARRQRVKPAAVAALQARLQGTQVEAAEAAGAWALLADLTEAAPTGADAAFLLAAWDAARAACPAAAQQVAPSLLRCVAAAAQRFPAEQAASLAAQLEARCTHAFGLPPPEAAAHLRACAALAACAGPGGEAVGWAARVLGRCTAALEPLLGAHSAHASAAAEQRARGALFACGQAALLSPASVRGELVTAVQGLVAGGGAVPASLLPHAWAALSKLCLCDERLAKRCVPLLVRELGLSPCAAVRNNLLVGLADLCSHHTQLVDPHALRLAACLGDPCELVRRQALTLLASLLQRDFLKWRGALFVRFAAALQDPAPAVRALAQRLMADPQLAQRVPLLSYTHFSEALFSLNGFDGGAAAAAAGRAAPVEEKSAFAMRGSDAHARGRRLEVLRALLRAMTPEHRLATAAKLCAEVLVPVAEGTMPLPACGEVLADALSALAAREMSFKAAPPKAAADEDEDEEGIRAQTQTQGPGGALAGVKARVVSSLAKRNLVEHFVPVLIELKAALTQQHSPLLGHLMACARGALRDLKGELEDILVADRQLAAELLFDLRQAEEGGGGAEAAPTRAQPPRGARRVGGAGGGRSAVAAPAAARTPATAPRRVSLAAMRGGATPGGERGLCEGPPQAPLSVPRLRATTPRTGAAAQHPVDADDLAQVCRRQSFSLAGLADENAGPGAQPPPASVHLFSPDDKAAPQRCFNLPPPAGAEAEGAPLADASRSHKRTRA